MTTNSNEAVNEDAEAHGQTMQGNDPVAEHADEVEGHALTSNANEPVGEDDDVEGHGLLRNAAIAAALTVGGGVAVAGPASASPVDDVQVAVSTAATPEAVSASILEMYGRSVPPEKLRAFIWDSIPADLRATGSADQIAAFLRSVAEGEGANSLKPETQAAERVAAELSAYTAEGSVLGSLPADLPATGSAERGGFFSSVAEGEEATLQPDTEAAERVAAELSARTAEGSVLGSLPADVQATGSDAAETSGAVARTDDARQVWAMIWRGVPL